MPLDCHSLYLDHLKCWYVTIKRYLNTSLSLWGKELMIEPSRELKTSKCWLTFLLSAHTLLNQNAGTAHLLQRVTVNWFWFWGAVWAWIFLEASQVFLMCSQVWEHFAVPFPLTTWQMPSPLLFLASVSPVGSYSDFSILWTLTLYNSHGGGPNIGAWRFMQTRSSMTQKAFWTIVIFKHLWIVMKIEKIKF